LAATASPAGGLAQEGLDRRGSLVLEREGRHRHPGVVGEEGDDRGDVVGFPGVDEASDELALARRVGQRGLLAVGGWEALLERFRGRA
jgi:hypothetical protein